MRRRVPLKRHIVIWLIIAFIISDLCLAPPQHYFVAEAFSMPPFKVRIELFFKDVPDLKDRVSWLASRGYRSFNVVNKNGSDDLLKWKKAIQQPQQQEQESGGEKINDDKEKKKKVDVCLHYSLKYQKVRRGTLQQNLDRLQDFLQNVDGDGESTELLLVSGSTCTKEWNTLNVLQQELESTKNRKFAVAYNPFFPDSSDRAVERRRLQAKIDSGRVSKIYLQFGTDLIRAKECLHDLRQSAGCRDISTCASIFLPTKQLIAQQKFRPWKGVFLSDEFLESPDRARAIVVELMRLYHANNVELLIEAPGVRKEADLELLESLLEEASSGGGEWPGDSTGTNTKEKGTEKDGTNRKEDNNKPGSSRSNKRRKVNSAKESSGSSIVTSASKMTPTELSRPAVVLFGSHDLRLYDNEALTRACCHASVLPVFLWEHPQTKYGVQGAAQAVLKDALRNLAKSLATHSLPLLCRNTNDSVAELCQIVEETGVSVVYHNREFTTESRARDEHRQTGLKRMNVRVVSCQSFLLYNIEQLDLTKGFHGGHWGTLMPFLKACKKQFGEPPRSESTTEAFARLNKSLAPSAIPAGVLVEDLNMAIMPTNTPWDKPIRERFLMNTQAAQLRLKDFFESGFLRYSSERSRADKDLATSQLSVHLRFGTLSPLELFWKTEHSDLDFDKKKVFCRRLFWRDLAYYQLLCFPEMTTKSIRSHYENTEWSQGDEERRRFRAWKKGMTGYPIVDAGMRELYQTGWMTQSVRMVVASFLCEYLRVSWTKGADWFHFTLADADVAINSMMWQNAGRSGIDQWNFVLSPETASQDPSSSYCRKWIPELAKLPKQYIHRPWQAPEDVLRAAGVVLGDTYPNRIVEDLKGERAQSVESVLQMRRAAQGRNTDNGYDIITLPTGENTVVFTKKEYRIDRSGHVMRKESVSSGKKKSQRTSRRRRLGRVP